MDKRIETIIKNFEFDTVHKTMTALNWKWSDAITEDGIPTIGQLMLEAVRLMEEVLENKWKGVSTGGFRVSHEPLTGYLALSFELTSADSLY